MAARPIHRFGGPWTEIKLDAIESEQATLGDEKVASVIDVFYGAGLQSPQSPL